MKKVAPLRSPMTVYGQPNNALADDKAPAMSVPSLYVRRLTSLSSHSQHLSLSLSRPLTLFSPSLLSLFVMFLGGGAFPSATMESCILQPQLSPEWVHLLSRLLLRITVLLQVPSFSSNTHTHKPVNRSVVRFCLWQRKAISRLFQSSVITWNVSLSQACFIRLGRRLKPFLETENIISYDLLWYKSKVSAVNPIYSHRCVCEAEKEVRCARHGAGGNEQISVWQMLEGH